MASNRILGALAVTTVLAFGLDCAISDNKLFGGTTPSTVSNKEWEEETDKRLQALPRTAGPPVVMNPITRQNFIDKDSIRENRADYNYTGLLHVHVFQSGKKGVTNQQSRVINASQGVCN